MTTIYTKIQLSDTLDNDAWMRASNEALGCLWRLLMLASRRTNGGRFLAVKGLGHKACVLSTGVTSREASLVVNSGLASWDGNDLVITGYDHVGMERLDRLVEVGRQQGAHGKLGGRPKKTPQGVIPETPDGVLNKPPISITNNHDHDQPGNTPLPSGEPDHAIFGESPSAERIRLRSLAGATPQQRWNLRQELMPWAYSIEKAGGKISANTVGGWEGVKDRHTLEVVLATIVRIGPCWHGDCETAIKTAKKPDAKTLAADAAASKYGKKPA